jgi:hypothetical protein
MERPSIPTLKLFNVQSGNEDTAITQEGLTTHDSWGNA